MTGVNDDAGNAGVGSVSSANYSVKTQRPGATVTFIDTTLGVGETIAVTIAFSENVSGFGVGNLDLTGSRCTLMPGSLQRIAGTNPTVRPDADVQGSNNGVICVDLKGLTNDDAGTGQAGWCSAAPRERPWTQPMVHLPRRLQCRSMVSRRTSPP